MYNDDNINDNKLSIANIKNNSRLDKEQNTNELLINTSMISINTDEDSDQDLFQCSKSVLNSTIQTSNRPNNSSHNFTDCISDTSDFSPFSSEMKEFDEFPKSSFDNDSDCGSDSMDIEAYLGEKFEKKSLIKNNYLDNPICDYLVNNKEKIQYNFSTMIESINDLLSRYDTDSHVAESVHVCTCIGIFIVGLLIFTFVMLLF